MARGTAKTKSGNNRTRGKKNTKARTGGRQGGSEQLMGDEVAIIILFAVAVLLMLSNLKLCGPIGEWLRTLQLGAFGSMGFVFPILLFLVPVFLVANRDNRYAVLKTTAACFMYIFLAAIFQFMAGRDMQYMELIDLMELGYREGSGGGLIGGALAMVLYRLIGAVGAVLLLLMAMLICLVYVTEKPLMRMIASFSVKTAERAGARAREDFRELSETAKAYHQERVRIREERLRDMSRELDFQALELGPAADGNALELEPANNSAETAAEVHEDDKDKREGELRTDSSDVFRGRISGVCEVHGTDMSGGIPMPRLSDKARHVSSAASEKSYDEIEDLSFDVEEYGMLSEASGYAATEDAGEVIAADFSDVMEHEPAEEYPYSEISKAGEAENAYNSEEPEAGTRTIVTSNGRIIESDVERIRKRVEKKREESGEKEENQLAQAIKEKKKPLRPYVYPPLSLLKRGGAQSTDSREEIQQNAITLQQTLKSFGVNVTVTNVSVGPAVTRYELQPEQGVKLSKIVSLTNDIKMRLAAADIRMEAPIPGKNAVGIEVPNKKGQTVFLGDILSSEEFGSAKGRLSFGVGKDIAGKVVVTDISKMPHLLVAGATGSGKSVSINTLIMSILYRYKPEEVRLIMVDPKVVELQVYNGIPHLLTPVVTDPKKAAAALNWAVAEMTDRYRKFAETGVRDLSGYNERVQAVIDDEAVPPEEKPEKLPQIVIIIDELADLMMVSAQEVEDAICRIAQLARACGMHLVIATQRPSVNVITGLIKANVPSRIAFAVSSGVDSRTILDMNGAEKLLGKGDMLFFPQGIPKPVRVQGAFVSDEEVQKVVGFLKEHSDEDYSEEVKSSLESSTASSAASSEQGDGRDELFAEAGQLIIDSDKASIGMLQRKFRIGFNRAARIMDQLADYGVVGPEEGTKPRRILMNQEAFGLLMSEEHL